MRSFHHKGFNRWIAAVLAVIMLLPIPGTALAGDPNAKLQDKLDQGDYEGDTSVYEQNPYYSQIIKTYGDKVIDDDTKITIDASKPTRHYLNEKVTNAKLEVVNEYEGRKSSNGQILVWSQGLSKVEYEFDIQQEGRYELMLDYFVKKGSSVSAKRGFTVDGELLFDELSTIEFFRLWRDKSKPPMSNVGDQIRPRTLEYAAWQYDGIYDRKGIHSDPLTFYFTPGRHSIEITFIQDDMAIDNFYLVKPREHKTYAQVQEEYQAQGYQPGKGQIRFEAEDLDHIRYTNSPSIRIEHDNDPATYPSGTTSVVYNTLGGWSWSTGNTGITWTFHVDEPGLYKIGTRYMQSWTEGLPSDRQILIDGKVPFEEMNSYSFTYGLAFQNTYLCDANKNPYEFYLEEGEHTLTFIAKMGDKGPVIESLYDDILLISTIVRDILRITGSNPDVNYDYRLPDSIPTLMPDLKKLIDSMDEKIEYLTTISVNRPSMANNFATVRTQLQEMYNNPLVIPRKQADLINAQYSLSDWMYGLTSAVLQFDYIVVAAPDENVEFRQSNFFESLWAIIVNFFISFVKDYDAILTLVGEDEKEVEIHTVLNVWTGLGREWAAVVKEMADSRFTPETGISINLNIMPASQVSTSAANALILNISSGTAPDAIVNVQTTVPAELAFRDAALDLSQFEDFDEVTKRFVKTAMTPFEYQGGYYALPETMNIRVMFYRKDIIEKYNIKIPDTWDELIYQTLPVLYQNNMRFIMSKDATMLQANEALAINQEIAMFVFQHGGEVYRENGLLSGLDSPEAYQGFKFCTELYTNYGLDYALRSIYTGFRTGEAPMCVADFAIYQALTSAAPELTGRWGMVLIPGMKQADGTINRDGSGGGITSSTMGLSSTEHPKEVWEFLKWWTSAETQASFGQEIENVVGPAGRWNTANVEAFRALPWTPEEIELIEESWEYTHEIPIVLGGYFTSRHMQNAYNRVVVDQTMNPRDSLEQAVKDINKELVAKQIEYGVNPALKGD